MAKLDVLHVPHTDTSLFATELIAGEVDIAFAGPTTVLLHVQPGHARQTMPSCFIR